MNNDVENIEIKAIIDYEYEKNKYRDLCDGKKGRYKDAFTWRSNLISRCSSRILTQCKNKNECDAMLYNCRHFLNVRKRECQFSISSGYILVGFITILLTTVPSSDNLSFGLWIIIGSLATGFICKLISDDRNNHTDYIFCEDFLKLLDEIEESVSLHYDKDGNKIRYMPKKTANQ